MKVTPSIVDDLRVMSDQVLTIQGNEGLTIGAKAIDMSGSNIILNAVSPRNVNFYLKYPCLKI